MEDSLMLSVGVSLDRVDAIRRAVQLAGVIATCRESLSPLVRMGGIVRLVVNWSRALAGGDAHDAERCEG